MTLTPTRELPAPWDECEMCSGPAAALPDTDGAHRCPACTVREALTEHALQHLTALLSAPLAAWAQHWEAAGLSEAQRFFCLDMLTGSHYTTQAQQEHLGALFAQMVREHPAPSVTPSPPDRVQIDALTLPTLTGFTVNPAREAQDGPGAIDRRLSFTARYPDGRERDTTLYAGPDALLILNATSAGDALLCFTGIHGQTAPGEHLAYRVPAAHLGAVRAALGYAWVTGGKA